MNMKTIKNLIIVSAFALLIINFGQASASSQNTNVSSTNQPTVHYQNADVFPRPTINGDNGDYSIPTNYVYTPSNVQYVYTSPNPAPARVITPPKTVVASTYTPSTVIINPANPETTNTYVQPYNQYPTQNVQPTNNGLTALSIQGSGGFMPSSIWQWFLVILLILAIIVIARMFTRSEHHEVHTHTVTGH